VASSLPATAISFAPSGTIAATNVQTAVAELDGETQTALALKANTANVLPLTGGILSGALTVQTVKLSGSGVLGNIGTAAEDALQIDATAKTIKALAPYLLKGDIAAQNLAQTGYVKLASGLIIQWGLGSGLDTGPVASTFAIPFPNAALCAVASCRTAVGASGIAQCAVTNLSVSQVTIGLLTAAGVWFGGGFYYIAVGY
jgi:hypothetical protein